MSSDSNPDDGRAGAWSYLESEFDDPETLETFGPLNRHAPGVLAAYVELRRHALSDSTGGLDARTRELLVLAITCMGRKTNPPPVVHVRKAMELGATVREIADVVALCLMIGGMITYQSTGRFILEAAEEYERNLSSAATTR
jgi:alkylhydroperoxidase/carboxymuconolactone decarboxylase family protein YurZ